ncbi:recombinase family protein [Blautia schinkii]|nr:recombinase family protein [Blautia schinkii]
MKEQMYSVAIYLRLSRDDEDIDGTSKSESNSISSQRELVRSYVREHDDMELFDIYVDDGYSGTNFDRPEFKRMMADIEAGNVNCVIVKDLSRLGRDYIEAGRLIQKTFPAFHVRFIAVTDSFDSQTADHNTKSLVLPVKNFINDSYCRDISQKVRSQKKMKRLQGKYIGAFAVYGYKKSEDDKYKLSIDDYAADVVRKIFAWRLEGISMPAIAQRLNGLGILSPLEYKRARGDNISTSFRTGTAAKWSPVAVKRILTNEMYTGVMVQGKYEKVSYKSKKEVIKPKEEWDRVKGTHEAIISAEDFETVQKLLPIQAKVDSKTGCAPLFSGFLFCGDCKAPMVRRINRYKEEVNVYYICSTRNNGEGCTRHSIHEGELRSVVFQIVQTYVAVFLDVCSQLEHIQKMEVDFAEVARFDKELERLTKEQEKYLELRAGLYQDLKSGLITEADFKNFRAIYEKQYEEAKTALQRQKEMIKQLFRNGVASGVRLEKLKNVMKLTELNRDTLVSFVSRVEVYEDKRVYVEFKSEEEFQKMLMIQDYVESKARGGDEV